MPHSPFGHTHERGDCYATWYAKRKAEKLVEPLELTEFDQDDIEQSLILGLLERWPKFDPSVCKPKEFITWAIKRAVADQIREQRRRLKFEPTEVEPLEDLLADDEEDLPTSCVCEDHAPVLDRAMDIQEAMSRLPPEIQEVGRLLMTYTVVETAQKLGVSRRTVRDRMERLRDALTTAGLAPA